MNDAYRKLLAEDRKLITYRPSLREIGGSVAGTILFQQIMYWDEIKGGKFWKFTSPCSHKMYKKGDSWEEELAMSAYEVRSCLKHFAFKCGKKNRECMGDSYEDERNNALVHYYTDNHRVTWYILNRELLSKRTSFIYQVNEGPSLTLNTETTPETTEPLPEDDLPCPF